MCVYGHLNSIQRNWLMNCLLDANGHLQRRNQELICLFVPRFPGLLCKHRSNKVGTNDRVPASASFMGHRAKFPKYKHNSCGNKLAQQTHWLLDPIHSRYPDWP